MLIALVVALIVVFAILRKRNLAKLNGRGQQEPRLIGTWLSDAERTLNGFSESDAEKLRQIFGKMKVTYTGSELHSELDGIVRLATYAVLQVDAYSCVIQDTLNLDPMVSHLGLSTFTKIHFEGENSYWVSTEIGGVQEYFRKIAD